MNVAWYSVVVALVVVGSFVLGFFIGASQGIRVDVKANIDTSNIPRLEPVKNPPLKAHNPDVESFQHAQARNYNKEE